MHVASRQECSQHHHVALSATEPTLLASLSAAQYGPGSSQCPWIITANKGQRINITLHNYARSLANRNPEQAAAVAAGGGACYEYAVIRDGDMRKTIVGCSAEPRINNVYLSRTNELEIHVADRMATSQALYFAMEYHGKC